MNDVNPDRLLVLAPHPDDEAIGTGALIQRILARGGHVRVLFLTDGENNSWPQRYKFRKWRITQKDRADWGQTRRLEALASLRTLGVPAEDASFLAFPDTRLSQLARKGDTDVLARLRTEIEAFRPSLLAVSSTQDMHADHRAAAWFAHHAVRGLDEAAPEIVTYVVHGEGLPSRSHATLELTAGERDRKLAAISCHQTQLLLSKQRFLAYARPAENFFGPEFDLVCLESRARERIGAVRHSCRVILGRSNPVNG